MVECVDLGSLTYSQAEEKENEYLVRYMKKYGWDKVRGGHLTNTDETIHLNSLKSHKGRNKLKGLYEIKLP
jgi:hypothetical protein